MQADDIIHIALAADENHLPGLEVARKSIVRSSSQPERLCFHVLRESNSLIERIRHEFGEYKGSVMAFLRLYLTELLPDVDWVVYADVDTVWRVVASVNSGSFGTKPGLYSGCVACGEHAAGEDVYLAEAGGS